MRLKLTTLILSPVLIVQGYSVKKNIPKLPEAAGVRTGVSGTGQQLRLLILGDSAAAGVGVHNQTEALSGALIKDLEGDFNLDWKLEAKTGRTTADLIELLHDYPSEHYDIVITSIGVNDVTKLISPQTWIQKQHQLYTHIQSKFEPKQILVTAVPPMNGFSALPWPLSWLFGQYAKEMNQLLHEFVCSKQNMALVEYDLDEYKKLNLTMAEDGFHPSQEIYQLWASKLSSIIRQVWKK